MSEVPISPEEAWRDLIEKDDRNSPSEYPEMALITADELADYMRDGVVWPDTGTLTMPRNADSAPPHPVLDALAEAAQPWMLLNIARALQGSGMAIPRRAEAEYAAALHWLVGHALRSGGNWKGAALADLETRKAAMVQEGASS